MDKDIVVYTYTHTHTHTHTHTMDCYSAIKRNAVESVLMRWMNLEPIIYSIVSQKEKNKYYTLMHIHGTLKDGID